MRFLNSWNGSTERAAHYFIAALLLCGLAACGEAPEPEAPAGPMMADADLKPLVTVSGVSAGGYLAVQAHVALAHRIGGVAALAGGPYDCANGSINQALGPCISGAGIDVAAIQDRTNALAEAGRIAPVAELSDTRVWLYHSPDDSVVNPRVSEALVRFYAAYVAEDNIRFENAIGAAHGWPTLASGRACEDWGGDFINACDYDASGALLQHLYGDLADRVAITSSLREIDMTKYFPKGSDVADTGYLYVPAGCEASDEGCRLHIALHGCKQGMEFLGDRFATQVGLNEWAESNRIVVVYPQVESSMFNPKGCWDWWGYTDADYANRNGRQVQGINRLIDAFARSDLISQ